MKKKLFLFLLLFLFIPFVKAKAIDISYQTHVQNIGWMDWVKNGELSGTTGLSRRMESIKIKLENNSYSGDILYQTHIQNIGWMDWVKNGELSGTTGLSRRMEAIRIKLSGELEKHYDIYYRTHIQNIGWMDWVKNGELSGTTGLSRRAEAIEIKLVPLSEEDISLSYAIHNNDGWNNYVINGEQAGSTGESKSIDLLKIKLNNATELTGDIKYQVNTTSGWSDEMTNDLEVGNKNKPIQAIKISLTDELEEKYNIFYRVHTSFMGWLDWTSNGEPAGTSGYFSEIEAIEVKLLPKDDKSIKVSSGAYKEFKNKVMYSSHVQGYGWQDYVSEGISGTTGESRRLEAIKISLNTSVSGNIVYKTYISRRGWSEETRSGAISGTTNLARPIEGISIKLEGKASEKFDLYYRVHVQGSGWLSWTKDGGIAGSINNDRRIEAIEMKLVVKEINPGLDMSKPLLTGSWSDNNTKYYDYYGVMATGFKLIDGEKCYFNSEGKLYAKNVDKVIDISSWQGDVDWETIKKQDDVDAAIIRVGWGTDDGAPCGLDSYFDKNIKEVQRLKIPYSIYIYAYANNEEYARQEADYVVSKMNQYNMPKSTWVWYDAELDYISRDVYNKVIPAFINRVKAAGYNNVGVYSGVSQLDTTRGNTNTSTIRSYPIWVAQYYKNLQYTGDYKGWQFSSTEHIDGIVGNVDVSMFKK